MAEASGRWTTIAPRAVASVAGEPASPEGSVLAGPLRLETCVEAYEGGVYCHAPAQRPFRIHDLADPDDGDDRWGGTGRTTIYLAGDPGVALAECARHLDHAAPAPDRRIIHLQLHVERLLDLRRRDVRASLGLVNWPAIVADVGLARRLGERIRATGVCQGIIAPSVAFLDRPERFNVVLFGEQLPAPFDALLTGPVEVARLTLVGD